MSVAPQIEIMQRKNLAFDRLAKVNTISIDQKFDEVEYMFQNLGVNFIENANIYYITFNRSKKNQAPDLIAIERSDICLRMCCKPIHPVVIEYYKPSSSQPEPYVSKKPFKCFQCVNCCDICAATVTTEFQGQEIGKTTERACTGLTPILDITVSGQNSGSFSGPSCCVGNVLLRKCLCPDQDLEPYELIREESKGPRTTVYTKRIDIQNKKKNYKFNQEELSSLVNTLTDTDNYTITFGPSMSSKEKLHMMSNVLLLDYLFHEQDGSNLSQGIYCGSFYCNGCIMPCRSDCNFNYRRHDQY